MSSYMTLPWPPTINTFYTVARNRKILSKRGRQYKKDAQIFLMKHKPSKIEGKVKVTIVANPPDRRKRDLDNILKPILDALTEYGVYDDDSDIDELTIIRSDIRKFGDIYVRVDAIQNNSSTEEVA